MKAAQAALLLVLALPVQAGEWRLVTQGDCPGKEVQGSAGEAPDPELCTPAFAGKTALCFTQVCYPGCQYIDVPTPQCRGGAEMAHVYTCVAPAPGP
jgi:hypothetical protein